MSSDDQPTPQDNDLPGGWPETAGSQTYLSYGADTGRPNGTSRLPSHVEDGQDEQVESKSSSFGNLMEEGNGSTVAVGAASMGVGYGAASDDRLEETSSGEDTAVGSSQQPEVSSTSERPTSH